MNERPWYHDGLRFACTECGDCCVGEPGFVWVNKEEIETLAAELKLEVSQFEQMYVRRIGIRKSLKELSNGDCVFFDKKKRACIVYGVRPRQCRTWPFWNSNLRTPKSWESTRKACPGCGKGRLHRLGRIEQLRSVIRI